MEDTQVTTFLIILRVVSRIQAKDLVPNRQVKNLKLWALPSARPAGSPIFGTDGNAWNTRLGDRLGRFICFVQRHCLDRTRIRIRQARTDKSDRVLVLWPAR